MHRTTALFCVAGLGAAFAASCSQSDPAGGTGSSQTGVTGASGTTNAGSAGTTDGTTGQSGSTTTTTGGGTTGDTGTPGGTTSTSAGNNATTGTVSTTGNTVSTSSGPGGSSGMTSTGGPGTTTGGPGTTTGGPGSTTNGSVTTGSATTTTGTTGTTGRTTTGSTTSGSTTTGTTGRTTTGTTGTTGTSTSTGARDAGAGDGSVSIASVVPTLDGYLWIGTCATGTPANLDCPIHNDQDQCPTTDTSTAFAQRGAFQNHTITVGGVTGQKYTINFEVRGVAGGKTYTGGTAASTTYTEGPSGNNSWYVGGTPTDSKWNTWEMHVSPAVPGEANVYYLNAFTATSGFDGRHETLVIKFTASFAVLGGGTITLTVHDSNCLGQQNCGQTVEGQTMCPAASARIIDLSGMMPPPPSTFMQPVTENNFLPQWLFFDVKSVTSP